MLSPESSIAFYISGYPIKFYSLIMFFAISFGSILSYIVAKKHYNPFIAEKFLDILPIVILCGILGARLYYVFMDLNFYSQHPAEIFAVYKGGLSIHGAIIGGFAGGAFYIKKHNLHIWKFADIFAYGLILGQAIGRFGNYFNIEAFGKPCNYSTIICMQVPQNYRPIEYPNITFFHPTFLYESIINIFILFILYFAIRKKQKDTDGIIFFSYLGLYSLGRFFIEGLRLDSVLSFGQVHIAQIVSIILIIICLSMLYKLKQKTN